jgi:molecular chaperone GrpE
MDKNNNDDIFIEEEPTPDLLKKLRDDLKKCNTEKAEYLAGWQRAKADYINARKEEEERRGGFADFIVAKTIKDFLPVLDSMEMSFKDESWQKLDKTWQDGIKYTHSQLEKVLKDYKVEEIPALGEKFNPAVHESVEETKIDNKENDNIIIDVVRKGYKINDEIIRPAQVKINKL